MTRTRTSARYVLMMSVFGFSIFLLYLLALGRSFQSSLALAAMMGAMTAFTATVSYASRAYMHRQAFSGKKQAAASMDTHQRRIVEIDLPYDAAFALALDAVESLDGQHVPLPDNWMSAVPRLLGQKQMLQLYQNNPETGRIRAGLRARTLGISDVFDFSQLDLKLEKIDATTTRIHIDSQAKTLFELYDLGKNLHYVNQLALYLRRESQQHNAEARLSEGDTPDAETHTSTEFETRREQGEK